MTKAMIQHEINVLVAKMREAARLDKWELFDYDDEVRLEYLRAKLEAFEV